MAPPRTSAPQPRAMRARVHQSRAARPCRATVLSPSSRSPRSGFRPFPLPIFLRPSRIIEDPSPGSNAIPGGCDATSRYCNANSGGSNATSRIFDEPYRICDATSGGGNATSGGGNATSGGRDENSPGENENSRGGNENPRGRDAYPQALVA